MSIEADFRTFLLAGTTITGLVGSRCYAGQAPKGARESGDFMVLRKFGDMAEKHFGGAADVAHASFEVFCYSSTAAGRTALNEAVRKRADGYHGDFENLDNVDIDLDDAAHDTADPDDESELQFYLARDTFLITYRRSVPDFE